jgi:hypothetical protein
MTRETDPMELIRESRIRMSHAVGNDTHRLVAELRKLEGRYATQIARYQHAHQRVAEDQATYGKPHPQADHSHK